MGEGQPTVSPPPMQLFHPGDLGEISELGNSRGAFSDSMRPEVSSGSVAQTLTTQLVLFLSRDTKVTQGHSEAASWVSIPGSKSGPGPAISWQGDLGLLQASGLV